MTLFPNLAFLPKLHIYPTLDHTAHFAHLKTRLPLRKHFKSRLPAASISCLSEVVAADKILQPLMMVSWDTAEPQCSNSFVDVKAQALQYIP
jgi:hypothetical protein